MNKPQTQQILERQELEILRDRFLQPEEMFLLGYLKEFDRKKNKKFEENEMWEVSVELDEG